MGTVGSVYILENSRVPGIVKVGRTDNIDRRLSELNSHAGMAGRWQCAGYVTVSDCVLAERLAHQALSDVRDSQSGGTEMFNCSVDHAGLAISNALRGQTGIETYKDQLPAMVRKLFEAQKSKEEKFRQAEEERKRLAEKEKKHKKNVIKVELLEFVFGISWIWIGLFLVGAPIRILRSQFIDDNFVLYFIFVTCAWGVIWRYSERKFGEYIMKKYSIKIDAVWKENYLK